MLFRDIQNLLLGLKSRLHFLQLHKKLHTNIVFRLQTCSYSCEGNKLLGASNELVHCISQLVISAWIHSSASYKQPTALPELRHTHTNKDTRINGYAGTSSQRVRNPGLWVASETGWPLQKKHEVKGYSPITEWGSVLGLWFRSL